MEEYHFLVRVQVVNATSKSLALEMARGVMNEAQKCAWCRNHDKKRGGSSASIKSARLVKKKSEEGKNANCSSKT